MSAFPTLPHHPSSRREPSDGSQVDYGDDGLARVRVMYTATQWTFNLVLPELTATEMASLEAHYAANKLGSFSYTWPQESPDYAGIAYTCVYLACPLPTVSAVHDRRDATVMLAGVAA